MSSLLPGPQRRPPSCWHRPGKKALFGDRSQSSPAAMALLHVLLGLNSIEKFWNDKISSVLAPGACYIKLLVLFRTYRGYKIKKNWTEFVPTIVTKQYMQFVETSPRASVQQHFSVQPWALFTLSLSWDKWIFQEFSSRPLSGGFLGPILNWRPPDSPR